MNVVFQMAVFSRTHELSVLSVFCKNLASQLQIDNVLAVLLSWFEDALLGVCLKYF